MCNFCTDDEARKARQRDVLQRAATLIPDDSLAKLYGSLFVIHQTTMNLCLLLGNLDPAETHRQLADIMIDNIEGLIPKTINGEESLFKSGYL